MDNETVSINASGTTNSSITISEMISDLRVEYNGDRISTKITKKSSGINPTIYFKYIKRKLSMLEKMKIESRLKKLTKAFDNAVDNGQDYLGEKIMKNVIIESRQTLMFAKGIKLFIDRDELHKYKHKIRGGHISDTLFKEYTRAIPQKVLDKKVKVEKCFDSFIIYHYYNPEAIKAKEEKGEKMDAQEKANMKDPILFGRINESSRLYFIADWDDEYCDLTFDELVDELGKDESDITISRNPTII